MLKTIEKEELVMANALEICEGRWTREENGSKSVLDYVLVDKEMGEHIKKFKIYEGNKDISPFRL